MGLIRPTTANQSWIRLLRSLSIHGSEANPRSMVTKEILAFQSVIDMNYPIVTVPRRVAAGENFHSFMFAEAHWILTGQNRVSSIKRFSASIERFSDDRIFYHGAYGPKIVDQLTHVVDCLDKDPMSRQAVINIWRENPRVSKDIPCTISVQFVIRDGKLHCFDTMRSSDAWLGWPFDVFNFSMLAWMVLTLLRCRCNSDNHVSVGLELGSLHLTAGSQHLYIKNQDAVHEILADWTKSPSVPEYRLSTKTYIPLDTVLDNLSVKANALKCHHEIDPEKLFKPMFELAVAGQ